MVQLGGAALAAWFLQAVIHVSSLYGSNYPAANHSGVDAFLMETVLTFGLVSVILGTASGAQNVGVLGALGVGSYIALAGLWASPLSGASMNPARTFGPDLVVAHFSQYWVYVAGPVAGARWRSAWPSCRVREVAAPVGAAQGSHPGRQSRGSPDRPSIQLVDRR